MEADRIRYILASYYRTRLAKARVTVCVCAVRRAVSRFCLFVGCGALCLLACVVCGNGRLGIIRVCVCVCVFVPPPPADQEARVLPADRMDC